jgi:hypothetical protein
MYTLGPPPPFDWPRAIERNRDALTAILATLFAMLGLQAGATLGRTPRQLHRAVLRVLRPAESATRRLIVIAARGLVAKPMPVRAKPQGLAIAAKGSGRMAFQLFRYAQALRPSAPAVGPAHHPACPQRLGRSASLAALFNASANMQARAAAR